MSDDHPSLDELAELDEGLLPAERHSAVRAHLADCAQCRARADAITSTRRALAALPPVTMPADVSARIDQNLAAAAPGPVTPRLEPVATEPDGDDEVVPVQRQSETVIPDVTEIHRSRFQFGRPTAAAAAVVIVLALAVTAVVVGYHNRSNGSDESAGSSGSTSAGSPSSIISSQQPGTTTKSSTGQTYTSANLDTLTPALLGSAERPPAAEHAPSSTAGANTATPALPSYSDAKPTSSAPIAAALKPLADSEAKLLACAARITTDPNAVPLAVDFGYWTGDGVTKAPAAVFVFKGADASKLTVFVTNATCSGPAPIRTAHFIPAP